MRISIIDWCLVFAHRSDGISHGVVAAHLSLGSLMVKIKEVLPACSIHE